jgi:hypothetical protein
MRQASSSERAMNVHVYVSCAYRVMFGQQLAVVGMGALLGEWAPARAVPMRCIDGSSWECELRVPAGCAALQEHS